jgi:hypothetical protein
VPEGLSPVEAGNGLKEHVELDEEEREQHRNLTISIVEATLLAVVAVLAAYSGSAAAKWSTESSLRLASASAARAEANAANLEALNSLNFDVTAFNAWFTAYVAGDRAAISGTGPSVTGSRLSARLFSLSPLQYWSLLQRRRKSESDCSGVRYRRSALGWTAPLSRVVCRSRRRAVRRSSPARRARRSWRRRRPIALGRLVLRCRRRPSLPGPPTQVTACRPAA